jgi:hypothetical protein
MKDQGLYYCHQMPVASPRKSFKTIMSPNSTLDGNYIIVFQKNDIVTNNVFTCSLVEAMIKSVACARKILAAHDNVTTQDLYDGGMLKDAFEEGYLDVLAENYSSLTDILSKEFDFVDGIWREKKCIGC